jgi:hypothetical protein
MKKRRAWVFHMYIHIQYINTYLPNYIHSYIGTYKMCSTFKQWQNESERDGRGHTNISNTKMTTYLHTYVPTYLHIHTDKMRSRPFKQWQNERERERETGVGIHTCPIHKWLPTYTHTYMPTSIGRYICTYKHTKCVLDPSNIVQIPILLQNWVFKYIHSIHM